MLSSLQLPMPTIRAEFELINRELGDQHARLGALKLARQELERENRDHPDYSEDALYVGLILLGIAVILPIAVWIISWTRPNFDMVICASPIAALALGILIARFATQRPSVGEFSSRIAAGEQEIKALRRSREKLIQVVALGGELARAAAWASPEVGPENGSEDEEAKPVNLRRINCPRCGGSLTAVPGQPITCHYCGAVHEPIPFDRTVIAVAADLNEISRNLTRFQKQLAALKVSLARREAIHRTYASIPMFLFASFFFALPFLGWAGLIGLTLARRPEHFSGWPGWIGIGILLLVPELIWVLARRGEARRFPLTRADKLAQIQRLEEVIRANSEAQAQPRI
jgi:hypothetical protein